MLHPVLRREPPLRIMPCIANLLIPGSRIHPASIVVIPEDTQPSDVQLFRVVDLIVDGVKHVSSNLMNARDGRRTALQRDAAPVKVVANIEDEFGLGLGGSLLHLGCDQQAGLIIHAVVVAAVWLATIATTSIEANRHLTVCAATGAVGKDVGANFHPTIVLNHPHPAIWRHHSSIHSAPVTDNHESHRFRAMEDHLRPFDAVMFRSSVWDLWHGSRGTIET
mmetsp:Transcript_78535/g.123908  ORF Transcript_78535/g.123908 Transcript_78535/m.123908 type:complete len:222 (-) Transcript_78535:267-932(-)